MTSPDAALAWVLKRSPAMLPIPDTSKEPHIEENVAAATIALSDEAFAAVDKEGQAQSSAPQAGLPAAATLGYQAAPLLASFFHEMVTDRAYSAPRIRRPR